MPKSPSLIARREIEQHQLSYNPDESRPSEGEWTFHTPAAQVRYTRNIYDESRLHETFAVTVGGRELLTATIVQGAVRHVTLHGEALVLENEFKQHHRNVLACLSVIQSAYSKIGA